ncbi:MAG: hypothetical protein M3365_06630, partial [Gemmatimonadota bacterium]|nr:hypothetical protein [Gemmatimonadota bacterium]
MDEERVDQVLDALPRDFNDPPPPPFEEMWAVIEAAHFDASARGIGRAKKRSLAPWLAAAATLVLGIGIGRYLPSGENEPGDEQTSASIGATVPATTAEVAPIADAYREQTNQYLGQTAA